MILFTGVHIKGSGTYSHRFKWVDSSRHTITWKLALEKTMLLGMMIIFTSVHIKDSWTCSHPFQCVSTSESESDSSLLMTRTAFIQVRLCIRHILSCRQVHVSCRSIGYWRILICSCIEYHAAAHPVQLACRSGWGTDCLLSPAINSLFDSLPD